MQNVKALLNYIRPRMKKVFNKGTFKYVFSHVAFAVIADLICEIILTILHHF